MKKCLADGIEQYLKTLIARSHDQQIEIKRLEIAETFKCVPSQVTYVLRTRFIPAKGYYTESHRGSQGYVKIIARHGGQNQPVPKSDENILESVPAAYILNQREKAMIDIILANATRDLPRETKKQVQHNIIIALEDFFRASSLGRRSNDDM